VSLLPFFTKSGIVTVQRGGGLDSVRVRGDGRTADVVTEQVGQRPVRADGETRRAREIIFRDNGVLHFIVIAHEVRGHAVDGGFGLFSIAIIAARLRDLFGTEKSHALPEESIELARCDG
jgi:hypothetical protein